MAPAAGSASPSIPTPREACDSTRWGSRALTEQESHMQTDRYTKAVLTIIAVVLIVRLVREDDAPAQVAVARQPDAAAPVVVQPPPVIVVQPPPVAAEPTKVQVAEAPPTKIRKPAKQRTAAPPVASPPPVKSIKPPPAAESCDAVTCEINPEGACCDKHRKVAALPLLDKKLISDGMSAVRARVMACGAKSAAKGVVTIKVYVASAGSVTKVNVESSPDAALGACVAAAAQTASFADTQKGGSFRIPFTF